MKTTNTVRNITDYNCWRSFNLQGAHYSINVPPPPLPNNNLSRLHQVPLPSQMPRTPQQPLRLEKALHHSRSPFRPHHSKNVSSPNYYLARVPLPSQMPHSPQQPLRPRKALHHSQVPLQPQAKQLYKQDQFCKKIHEAIFNAFGDKNGGRTTECLEEDNDFWHVDNSENTDPAEEDNDFWHVDNSEIADPAEENDFWSMDNLEMSTPTENDFWHVDNSDILPDIQPRIKALIQDQQNKEDLPIQELQESPGREENEGHTEGNSDAENQGPQKPQMNKTNCKGKAQGQGCELLEHVQDHPESLRQGQALPGSLLQLPRPPECQVKCPSVSLEGEGKLEQFQQNNGGNGQGQDHQSLEQEWSQEIMEYLQDLQPDLLWPTVAQSPRSPGCQNLNEAIKDISASLRGEEKLEESQQNNGQDQDCQGRNHDGNGQGQEHGSLEQVQHNGPAIPEGPNWLAARSLAVAQSPRPPESHKELPWLPPELQMQSPMLPESHGQLLQPQSPRPSERHRQSSRPPQLPRCHTQRSRPPECQITNEESLSSLGGDRKLAQFLQNHYVDCLSVSKLLDYQPRIETRTSAKIAKPNCHEDVKMWLEDCWNGGFTRQVFDKGKSTF